MIAAFDIVAPGSVAEASALLRQHGPDAAIYAGGTELLILLKDRLLEPALLVDIKRIPGLDAIALDPCGCLLRIGALATHRRIERSETVRTALPELAATEANVANIRVRHAGTIGGNLAFAEPHSDPATLLIALGAAIALESDRGRREVPAEAFFTGFLSTAREPEELIVEIMVPTVEPETKVVYERFKIHERPSASLGLAMDLADGRIGTARLVVGCIGERPVRMTRAEAVLAGQEPSAEVFAAAAELVREEADPTVDAFESGDYKRQLAATLALRALERAAGTGTGGAR
ncbi:MAG: FAD binding domain-containing protein [Chloroflexota bacterium]